LLRHYATSLKVAGSGADEVDFFNLSNPSSRTLALDSTQPLTEMSTKNLPGGKVRPARKVITLLPSVSRLSRKYGSLDVTQLYGPSRFFTFLLCLSKYVCLIPLSRCYYRIFLRIKTKSVMRSYSVELHKMMLTGYMGSVWNILEPYTREAET
jgi:hypothetical protein